MSDSHDPTPTVDAVGGWSSARLLVRILHAIDSPWSLSADGLTHEATGETCLLQMRGAEASLLAAVRREECPVRPSLSEETLEEVADHRTIVRIRALHTHNPSEARRAVLRCAGALVDAGAHVIRVVESQLCHGGAHLQSLALLAADSQGRGEHDVEAQAQYLALVHPLTACASGHRTVGMGLLGHPDAWVTADVPDAVAVDGMEAVHRTALSGRSVSDGDQVAVGPARPKLRVSRVPDFTPSDKLGHNPFGMWRLDHSG